MNYNFRDLLQRSIFLFAFLCLLNVKGQGYALDAGGVDFSFVNTNRTTISGTPGAVGSVVKYANMATVAGRVLYGKMTVVSLLNTTITTYDNDPGGADNSRFQPIYTTTTTSGGYAEFKLEFFDNETDFPVYLTNFYLNGIDLDSQEGSGVSNVNRTEYYRLPANQYSVYTLDSATNMAVTTVGTDIQFRGSGYNLAGIIFDNTGSFYVKYEAPRTSINFKIGANAAMTARQTAMKMGINGTFTNPVNTTNNTNKNPTDLAITKTVSKTKVAVGSEVIFTVTATNNGPNAATNVNVGDKLPAGFTFVSAVAPAGTSYNRSTGVWTIGNMANGASVVLRIIVNVNATGSLNNLAGITGNETESNTANNSASASVSLLDSDGDGIPDGIDLDSDNDGILDAVENSGCSIPDPEILPGNGFIVNKLFKEDFGTQSITNGTRSVTLPEVGSAGSTTYNYYTAIAGTTPTSSADGASSPTASLQDGRYTVFNNIQQVASFAKGLWQNIGDHTGGVNTPGTGRMFIVNAGLAAGEFYRKTITGVTAGAPLNASLWAMNLDVNSSGNISRLFPNITVKFIQGGVTVFSFNTGNIPRAAEGSFSAWNFYKNSESFIPTSNLPIELVLMNNGPGGSGNDLAIDDIIVYQSFCDTDNDGIPDYLDLDSDGDGCPDAIEGGGGFTVSQLVSSSMPGGNVGANYNGTSIIPVNQNLGNVVGTTQTTNGVPIIAGNGQTVGSAKNPLINNCAPVCTEPILGETFTVADGVTKTFIQPATTYGYTLDIFSLDNSFNMNINDVNIATSEIEFQSDSTPAPGINIRFVDGTYYESGTGKIWEMKGTPEAPLIRVVISSTGAISMFGSKVSGGPLFPLELFNGNSFNSITWNTDKTNTLKVTQNVVNVTNIFGHGYGLSVIPCPCYKPANKTGAALDTTVGITAFQRAGQDNGNWPMVRKGAHIALEAKTKGFVPTRVANPVTAIANPVEGMMVYDTTLNCLRIYVVDNVTPANSSWRCVGTQTCPE